MSDEVATIDSTEIKVYEAPRPVDLRAGITLLSVQEQKVVLAEYKARRDHFRQWLLSQLVEGTHYGFPPGCEAKYDKAGNVVMYDKRNGGWKPVNPKQWRPKASLYKAGALYLVDLLKLKAIYESDLDAWKMMGEPKGTLVRTCKLINPKTGEFLGEGTGTYEVNKKGMDSNAAIKMADKTAVVAAVINTLAMSDLFTQDMEERKPGPDHISQEMEGTDFKAMVQKWVTDTMKKTPLAKHEISNSEIKALRANLSIWCKGKIPPDAQSAIEWCRTNVQIVPTESKNGDVTGIKFTKKDVKP